MIDLALLPYAGGSGYPMLQNLDHNEKLIEETNLKSRYDEFVTL